MPAGKSLLRTGADGAGEDVVLRQLAVQEGAEHVWLHEGQVSYSSTLSKEGGSKVKTYLRR